MTSSSSRALPYAAVAIAASSWGAWGLIIRRAEAIAPMPAALESTVVMATITLVAGVASLRDRASEARTWKTWACVGWYGVADVLNMLLFFSAYKLTIAVAVLTHYLTPIFVALMAPLVLREKMTPRTAFAIAVSFFGLAVMLAPSSGGASKTAVWTSAALGGASAVFYASNVLVNKFVTGAFSVGKAMFWHGVVATLLGLMLVPTRAWAHVEPRAVVFLGVAAIAPGGVTGLAFLWGLRRMPAAHASTLTLLEPVVSLFLGSAVLGERMRTLAVVGGALILTGAVMVMTPGPAPALARKEAE